MILSQITSRFTLFYFMSKQIFPIEAKVQITHMLQTSNTRIYAHNNNDNVIHTMQQGKLFIQKKKEKRASYFLLQYHTIKLLKNLMNKNHKILPLHQTIKLPKNFMNKPMIVTKVSLCFTSCSIVSRFWNYEMTHHPCLCWYL